MSVTKISSEIFKIETPIEDVYALLSDFDKIGRLTEMAKQMGVAGENADLQKLSEKVERVCFTKDTCCVTLKNMGDMLLQMVEREEPKLIKLESGGVVPFKFNVWIQLLENAPYDTRMKITFQGELNMMFKMLLKGKLEKGINLLGENLTKIPYGLLNNFNI